MASAFHPSIAESERFWRHECPDARPIGGDRYESCCTMHGGDNSHALAIDCSKGAAFCHTRCNKGWGILEWTKQRYGYDDAQAWEYINEIIGRRNDPAWTLPFRPPTEITNDAWRLRQLQKKINEGAAFIASKTPGNWVPRAIYVYGNRVKVRYDRTDKPGEKQMRWFEVGPNNEWRRKLDKDKITPLYREGEVLAAAAAHKPIVLANGEKATDRVKNAGWSIAVTNLPNGEKSWNAVYLDSFRGAEVVYVVADNDDVGRAAARHHAGALVAAGIPARVVSLPNLPESGDLWDWDNAGRSFNEFLTIAEASPIGEPQDAYRGAPSTGTATDKTPVEGPDLTRYEQNDVGNAERILIRADGDVIYCKALRGWLEWDGTRWRPDAEAQLFARAIAMLRQVCAQASVQGNERLWKFGLRSNNNGPIGSMLHIASRMVAVEAEHFDRYPNLIPLANGIYDIEKNEFRPARREDYFTRTIPHRYDKALPPPQLFLRTLEEVMGGGPDASNEACERCARMMEYLQVIFGYCLTGDVTEKSFFCFFGPTGNNGKSTILSVFEEILGPYALRISADTLCKNGTGEANKRSELASTRGARLAVCGEPTKGQKFDQSLLKLFTQGTGTVSANFKFHDSFTFVPTSKLLLECNDVPRIDTDDDAFLKRLHAIRFPVEFQEERINRHLGEQLRPEYDQILTWGIAGAVRWRKEGLLRPIETTHEVAQLKRENIESDGLDDFFADACVIGPPEATSCTFPELMVAYGTWCQKQNQRPMSANWFSSRLRQRSYLKVVSPTSKHKGNCTRVYGITTRDQTRAAAAGRDAQFKDNTE